MEFVKLKDWVRRNKLLFLLQSSLIVQIFGFYYKLASKDPFLSSLGGVIFFIYPLKLWIKWIFFLIIAVSSSTLLLLKDNLPLSLLGDLGKVCLGVLFCRYFQLILNHIENRFLFLNIINHSEELKGEITFSKSFLYNQISIKYVCWGVMWLVLFILVGHLFFLGGIVGTLIQMHFISKWEK